jgi:ATP/maltotriose-dependent transcriptional regulator MalT/two-component SAPR family response regulator
MGEKKHKSSAVVKITRPKVSGIVLRERLFKSLDSGRKNPIIWLSAPAGSGKTTLIASWLDAKKLPCIWYQMDEGDADLSSFFYYIGTAERKANPRKRKPMPLLTPEYLAGIPTFTRRYFEELYGRLKLPFVIVFDNYHDVPLMPEFHEMIACGLDIIPEGINVVIVSRHEPPSQFARLKANRRMSFLGWNELRFTPEEIRDMVQAVRGERCPEDNCPTAQALQEKTDGWAAGLTLMLSATDIHDGRTPPAGGHCSISIVPGDAVFDYFAGEVFEKRDKELQEFLLKTSFLPSMTAPMAEKLTGINDAQIILSMLSRSHYFIDWHPGHMPVYQYHSLFRDFLMDRAKDLFSHDELSVIICNAASVLQESGQVEDAAGLYIQAGRWANLASLALNNAQDLTAQGRTAILDRWLSAIPKEISENSPWILYWSGICRQLSNPPEAKKYFERAYNFFDSIGDFAGALMSWSAIVDTYVFEWNDFTPLDHWIEKLDGHMQSKQSFPFPEIEMRVVSSMTSALMIRQPHRYDIGQWLERAISLARNTPDINLRIQTLSYAVNYYVWTSSFINAKTVMEEIRKPARLPDASPLLKITWLWLEAIMSVILDASPDIALERIRGAIDLADTTGIHVWDHMLFAIGAYASLLENNLSSAYAFLKKQESALLGSRRHGYCHYLYLSSWYHYLNGDLSSAFSEAKTALKIAEETGYVFPVIQCCFEMAHVLHAMGHSKEAEIHLSKAYKLCVKTKSALHLYMHSISSAHFAFGMGKEKAGLKALKEALTIGRQIGCFYLLWWWHPSMMSRLCAKALDHGIEAEYAKDLIRKCRLMPDIYSYIENWPWPLKIYTLGRFEIIKDGEPVSFSGKVQKKPLEMLKALIAFGGVEVPEEQLNEALWPEAEGDAAHNAFTTCLARLRRLIGNEKTVVLQEGKVSIADRFCWIDAFAFDRIFNRANSLLTDKTPQKDKVEMILDLTEKAVALYNGHFLQTDEDLWAVSFRERLKNKFMRLIATTGALFEDNGKLKEAVEYYQRALDIDDLSEEFYRKLMTCYYKLGQRAEAMKTYLRCREVLFAVFKIQPSQETESLISNILQN